MRRHLLFIAFVLILLVNIEPIWANNISSQDAENIDCNLCDFEITDDNDKEQLIAIYQVNFLKQDQTNELIDDFLDRSYDKILMSIYLSHVLHLDEFPKKSLQRIEQFVENEKANSLPYFLLSYYYLKKKEYVKSLGNLEKANSLPTFEDYTDQRKKVTKSYLDKSELNEICILSQSMFSLTNFPFFLAKMSRENAVKEDKNLRNELLTFSQTYEKHSKDLISKLASLSSQTQLINKEKEPVNYETAKSNFKYYQEISGQISTQVSDLTESQLIKYMNDAYELGELMAVEIQLAENNTKK